MFQIWRENQAFSWGYMQVVPLHVTGVTEHPNKGLLGGQYLRSHLNEKGTGWGEGCAFICLFGEKLLTGS